jgi:hypothetical protein
VSYAFAKHDLAHIENVIGHFECTVDRVSLMETGPVASVNYWRARVTTILATSSQPLRIEQHARELLERLD